jgi:hypothetical protein
LADGDYEVHQRNHQKECKERELDDGTSVFMSAVLALIPEALLLALPVDGPAAREFAPHFLVTGTLPAERLRQAGGERKCIGTGLGMGAG